MSAALLLTALLCAAPVEERAPLPELGPAPSAAREPFRPHRHAYLVGGLFIAAGTAFGATSRAEWLAGSNAGHARTAAYSWQSSTEASYAAVAALSIGAAAIIYAIANELLGQDAPGAVELRF